MSNVVALIINFDQTGRFESIDHSDTDGTLTVLQCFCTAVGIKSVVAESSSLRHVILTNSRNTIRGYAAWLEDLGTETCQRPITFSLLNCNVVMRQTVSNIVIKREYTDSDGLVQDNTYTTVRRLFPHHVDYGEAESPKVLLVGPVNRDLLHQHMHWLHKDLIFPYPVEQLEWLKNCHRILRSQGSPVEISEKDLNTCMNSYFNPEFPETTQSAYVSDKYYGYDLERFVVAVSHMACLAQKQELNLPPPPHPVHICPRHDTCTICTCLAASSGYYKAFGTSRNMTAFENSGELKNSTHGFCSWLLWCAFVFVFSLLVVFLVILVPTFLVHPPW